MTDEEYRKKISAHVRELDRVTDSDPFDAAAFHNIVESMQLVNCRWLRSRRYRHHHYYTVIVALVLILALVVFWISC